MKIYDISHDLMTARVYGEDLAPKLECVSSFEQDDSFKVSNISMCLHNGTHIDAPAHAMPFGSSIEKLPLEDFCGICEVLQFNEDIYGNEIVNRIKPTTKRLLIKGNSRAHLTPFAASEIVASGIKLVGIDDLTIATGEFETDVHRILLQNGVCVLEGLDLSKVEQGRYFLSAAPIKVKGAEAAPCRAFLISDFLLI